MIDAKVLLDLFSDLMSGSALLQASTTPSVYDTGSRNLHVRVNLCVLLHFNIILSFKFVGIIMLVYTVKCSYFKKI